MEQTTGKRLSELRKAKGLSVEEFAAKLGVKPEECLCVGDSPFDLQSGRSAGAQTVAVRYTAFGWEKLLEEGRPDFVIARPQELLEIVEKNR